MCVHCGTFDTLCHLSCLPFRPTLFFLSRVSMRQHVERDIVLTSSVRLSVCLSVHHVVVLYLNAGVCRQTFWCLMHYQGFLSPITVAKFPHVFGFPIHRHTNVLSVSQSPSSVQSVIEDNRSNVDFDSLTILQLADFVKNQKWPRYKQQRR